MGQGAAYGILAGVCGVAAVSQWLVFGGSPLAVANRVLRRLRVPYSVWRLRGQWYVFRDQPGSLTPVIVAGEIRRGLYDVKLHPGESVVDLGGHVGMFTIPLARENPDARFTVYEPNPSNYRNLVWNIARNGVGGNVTARNEGLAPHTCLLSSDSPSWNTGGSQSRPSITGKVPGITIQDILARDRPTVLKVDVEGAEFGAIQGDDLANVECVIMEVHGHLGDPSPVLEAAKKAGGYMVQVIDCPTQGIYVPGGQFPLKTYFAQNPATAGRLAEVPA